LWGVKIINNEPLGILEYRGRGEAVALPNIEKVENRMMKG
jgi:hypothetical protein